MDPVSPLICNPPLCQFYALVEADPLTTVQAMNWTSYQRDCSPLICSEFFCFLNIYFYTGTIISSHIPVSSFGIILTLQFTIKKRKDNTKWKLAHFYNTKDSLLCSSASSQVCLAAGCSAVPCSCTHTRRLSNLACLTLVCDLIAFAPVLFGNDTAV